MNVDSETLRQFQRLLEIMKTLRSPDGCPWDREQTFATMRKYVLEEAQEVAEAIDEKDPMHVCEELGDLSMIIVFLAQIAAESGTFAMGDALKSINDKLISRHPHVFGEKSELTSSGVVDMWKELKKQEKVDGERIFHRMNRYLEYSTPIHATLAVQKEAAGVGFDFPDLASAAAKISEEGQEILQSHREQDEGKLREEIGDLLFSVMNVARVAGFHPDELLKEATGKFISRFAAIEEHFADQGGLAGKTLQEMDQAWDAIKAAARAKPGLGAKKRTPKPAPKQKA